MTISTRRMPQPGEWCVVEVSPKEVTRLAWLRSEERAHAYVRPIIPGVSPEDVTFGPYEERETVHGRVLASKILVKGQVKPGWEIWTLPEKPRELRPEFDTRPHRAALRRAGVRRDVISALDQGRLVARGTLLLNQERVVKGALELASVAASRSAETVMTSGAPTIFGWGAWLEAVKEQARLEGLRSGIEFATHGEE